MFDPFTLPAAEQEAVRRDVHALSMQWGGDDIDRAIARDRKVLAEHERELDHVATLPFDTPYRWRIAPSVGLRAEKDLERQKKRRAELMAECGEHVMRERGHATAPEAPSEVTHGGPQGRPGGAFGDQVQQLSALLARAVDAVHNHGQRQERAEASPPAEPAVA